MNALIKGVLMEEGPEMAAAMHEAFKGINVLSVNTPNYKFALNWEKNSKRLLGETKYKESRRKKYPDTVEMMEGFLRGNGESEE